MLKNITKVVQNYRALTKFTEISGRTLATQAAVQPKLADRQSAEWKQAKSFSEIPGPNMFQTLKWFSAGGKLHGITMTEMHRFLRAEFGDIVKFKGTLGKYDIIMLYKPEDFETLFRTESVWPVRNGMEAFVYYRKERRPDLFKGIGGLVTEQGQKWHDFRTVVNPVMMQPKTSKVYIPRVDDTAKEFIEIIKGMRDENSETPAKFGESVNRWSLESISCIALDTRLGVMSDSTQDENAKLIIGAIREFFELSYQVDVLPSPWRYFHTPTFKRLMATSDVLTNVVMSYVESAMDRLEANPTAEENDQGVLEKLMKINKHTAKIMAFDMLLAGVDTTASAAIGILYLLAKNPEKQQKLREEIIKVLPTNDSSFTAENMRNLPYLRAVIKEGLRMLPPATGNLRSAGQDLIIQGYQIPKDSNLVTANSLLSNEDEHFPDSASFIPERWLRDTESACPHAKNVNPFVYLPFGFGARSCVGRRFADMEIEILVARMVRQFNMEWHYEDLKYQSSLLNIPISDLKFRLKDLN